MTGQETRQMNMKTAQNGIQHEYDIRREAYDVVPRTLLCSGIVFLSLVVPLYFNKHINSTAVRVCFRISASLCLSHCYAADACLSGQSV